MLALRKERNLVSKKHAKPRHGVSDKDFIFLDPPYDTDFSDYEKATFDKKDQERLAKCLYKTKAKFILIIKDTPFISSLYKNKKGKLSLKGDNKAKVYNAFPVSTTPYEWIECIDLEGDEYSYVPLIYCHFKGKTNWKFWKRLLFFRYPYKQMNYYKK